MPFAFLHPPLQIPGQRRDNCNGGTGQQMLFKINPTTGGGRGRGVRRAISR